jgi:hypothetical protein
MSEIRDYERAMVRCPVCGIVGPSARLGEHLVQEHGAPTLPGLPVHVIVPGQFKDIKNLNRRGAGRVKGDRLGRPKIHTDKRACHRAFHHRHRERRLAQQRERRRRLKAMA